VPYVKTEVRIVGAKALPNNTKT